MADALIIDAMRSPRGKGKQNGALHPIHPQRLAIQPLDRPAPPIRIPRRQHRQKRLVPIALKENTSRQVHRHPRPG